MKHRTLGRICAGGRIFSIDAGASVCEAARVLRDNRIGAVMVIDDARLTGILSERDIVARVVAPGRDPGATRVSEVMTRPVITAGPETDAVDALRTMQENGFRHLPVVGGDGILGMVSLRDFLGAEMAEVQDEISFEDAVAEELW